MEERSQTEEALWRLEGFGSYDAQMQYLDTLPRVIRTRVIGKILEKGQGILYMERLHKEAVEDLVRVDEAEERRSQNHWRPLFVYG